MNLALTANAHVDLKMATTFAGSAALPSMKANLLVDQLVLQIDGEFSALETMAQLAVDGVEIGALLDLDDSQIDRGEWIGAQPAHGKEPGQIGRTHDQVAVVGKIGAHGERPG